MTEAEEELVKEANQVIAHAKRYIEFVMKWHPKIHEDAIREANNG